MLFTPIIDNTHAVHHQYVRHIYRGVYHDKHMTDDYTPIALDRQRMDKAIHADRVVLPKGLDKSQIHAFLLNRAKQINHA
ncbi:Uncharacterised protein [Moraxella lacunata]|uniref:Uncharacterized protein n=1 Tax=Moraxella lacunata TaxID=477 RepID=A0A1V4GTA7_MORLA|nr:hypothetical protein [Moraxella lacunata]OPH35356.1 hypothetical protein B5J94_09815 [Moraxella lacunata]STZ01399.1 Uncharacterised protein [Moraxella lacunata]